MVLVMLETFATLFTDETLRRSMPVKALPDRGGTGGDNKWRRMVSFWMACVCPRFQKPVVASYASQI